MLKTAEGDRRVVKISVKDGKPCEKILKIEVGGEDIKREFEEFYKAIAPKAKIPGFRPGKAPREVLARHYQGEARENVLKNLISESYSKALQEKSIQPLGMPHIHDVDFKDEKLSYEAHVEIRPKIKLSKVTGLSVKKEKVELQPAEVEESLKKLQESVAQYKAVEDRPTALGDFIIADYTCTVEGKEIEKRSADWFELKEEEFLKGFSPQLVGMKPGDEKEVQVTFPADMGPQTEFAGKTGVFKVKVNEIKTRTLPPLDDELAKESGEFKTFAELRAKIEGDMRQHKEHEADQRYEKAIFDELIKQNKVELPEGLVKRRAEKLVEDALNNTRQRGVDEAKLAEIRPELEKDMAGEARRQIHLAFLLDEIADRENLSVSEEDIKAKYVWLAARFRQKPEDVEQYYSGREDALEGLKEQIRSEKAIDYVKKNTKS